MLWLNNKYTLTLHGGCARQKLDRMFGIIQQIIVIPQNKETIWSLQLLDKDMDAIFEVIDNEGRLDEAREIPIGHQTGEEPILNIFDSTSNEKFKVIIKVREII